MRAAVQAWFTLVPLPWLPSAKFHSASSGCALPGGPAATRVTTSPTSGVPVDTLIDTDTAPGGGGGGGGGWFGGVPGFDGAGAAPGGGAGWSGCPGWSGGASAPAVPFSPLPPPGLFSPRPGFPGSYLGTSLTPPSSRITPAFSLSGSLKKTIPSRVSSWNRVAGLSTRGRASTLPAATSTTQTWPVA